MFFCVCFSLDTYIVLIIGTQPCLHNQYGEAEGSVGFGRGKYAFSHLLINCNHPVNHCETQVADPARNMI